MYSRVVKIRKILGKGIFMKMDNFKLDDIKIASKMILAIY